VFFPSLHQRRNYICFFFFFFFPHEEENKRQSLRLGQPHPLNNFAVCTFSSRCDPTFPFARESLVFLFQHAWQTHPSSQKIITTIFFFFKCKSFHFRDHFVSFNTSFIFKSIFFSMGFFFFYPFVPAMFLPLFLVLFFGTRKNERLF